MFKKLILATAIASLVGCGSSDSSSSSDSDSGGDNTGTTTAAVITGTTSVELYYKGADASESLSIYDPDEGEEAFNVQTETATTYGLFSITADGDWTYEILENESYVKKMMIRLIIDQFKTKKGISLNAEDSKFINNLVVKEYLNEFNGSAA